LLIAAEEINTAHSKIQILKSKIIYRFFLFFPLFSFLLTPLITTTYIIFPKISQIFPKFPQKDCNEFPPRASVYMTIA